MRGLVQKPLLGDECMSDGTNPVDRNNVGKWLFIEGSGNIVLDLSGKKQTGTLVAGLSWVGSKFGSGLRGSDEAEDSISIADNSAHTGMATISFVFWAKHATGILADSDQTIVRKAGSGNDSYWVQFGANEDLYFSLYEPDVTLQITDVIDDANWHQYACTYDGTTMRAYKDAVVYSTTAARTGVVYDSAHPLYLMGQGSGSTASFHGDVDHIVIYGRYLSASEVSLLYQEPFCGLGPRMMNLYVPAAAAGNPWNYYAQVA